jgi:hypothetical protein
MTGARSTDTETSRELQVWRAGELGHRAPVRRSSGRGAGPVAALRVVVAESGQGKRRRPAPRGRVLHRAGDGVLRQGGGVLHRAGDGVLRQGGGVLDRATGMLRRGGGAVLWRGGGVVLRQGGSDGGRRREEGRAAVVLVVRGRRESREKLWGPNEVRGG